jgi:hypothetical protein
LQQPRDKQGTHGCLQGRAGLPTELSHAYNRLHTLEDHLDLPAHAVQLQPIIGGSEGVDSPKPPCNDHFW